MAILNRFLSKWLIFLFLCYFVFPNALLGEDSLLRVPERVLDHDGGATEAGTTISWEGEITTIDGKKVFDVRWSLLFIGIVTHDGMVFKKIEGEWEYDGKRHRKMWELDIRIAPGSEFILIDEKLFEVKLTVNDSERSLNERYYKSMDITVNTLQKEGYY